MIPNPTADDSTVAADAGSTAAGVATADTAAAVSAAAAPPALAPAILITSLPPFSGAARFQTLL